MKVTLGAAALVTAALAFAGCSSTPTAPASTPAAPASTAPERVVRYEVSVGPPIWLASNLFGTVGMQSARPAGNDTMGVPAAAAGSGAATPGSAPPATAGSGSGGAPSAVKYWAH